jgi:hypothetical protein
MSGQGHAHLIRPRFEDLEQIAVTAPEVLQHICQLAGHSRRIERQDAIDNVIGARAIG